MLSRIGQRVDYDRIAHLYDEPLRDHAPDPGLSKYLLENPKLGASDLRVLDMGCGTGKQLAANKEIYPDTMMIGLDLFRGMLNQARKRCSAVSWVQGDTSATPFPGCAFDYVTTQFSYSHVLDKNRLFSEAFRILKPGGRYVMTHLDPWSMPGWLVYRYFPGAQRRDYQDFLPAEIFVDRMLDAGFINTAVQHTQHNEKLNLGEFLEYVSQRHRTSQLMVISDQSYEKGLETLREDIRRFGDAWHLDSETCLVTITGDKS